MEFGYKTFQPTAILKPYVKFFWVCTCEEEVAMDIMYPSGYVELCIDISGGKTVRHFGNHIIQMPNLEILGHFTGPTRATIAKGTTVLVTRFHPYASSVFFSNPASHFNNNSIDLNDVVSKETTEFYSRLLEQRSLEQKIQVLETFLIQRLAKSHKKETQFKLVESMCIDINKRTDSFNLEWLASTHGYSERYIQKLFLDWVGLTPKSYHSVQRFNKSLEYIQSTNTSLTTVAYACGYYDQAHFIKEFKSFAGITPSQASVGTTD